MSQTDGCRPIDGEPKPQPKPVLTLRPVRERVLNALMYRGSFGMLDEELVELLAVRADTVRPRRRELVEQGLVIDTGRQRRTRYGRQATVWAIAHPKAELDEPWLDSGGSSGRSARLAARMSLRLVDTEPQPKSEIERRQLTFGW